MKTYTEKEQRENLEGACKALESNPEKSINKMRDGLGGRCCLAVMEDYARSIDPEVRSGRITHPHEDLAYFYGITNIYDISAFSFKFNNGDKVHLCNDGGLGIKEHTHKEIAARIREDFLS